MIDFKEFTTNVETPSRVPVPGGPKVKVSELRDDSLTDDEILLCKPTVYAFSMVAKRWGVFLVDNIKEVEYNKTAFDDLIIPQAQKSLIRSLVNDHAQNTSTYDDIIEGKGKGLIFLLHGPPGVGKTLTAESLADSTQRPLYTLGCGELSTSTVLVEKTLKRALELANRWNALVLIDEADVFMEQRDSHDLKRNELVSSTYYSSTIHPKLSLIFAKHLPFTVLLRVLEYFQGVMFLTTNRVSSIDSAFKSRIHLSLYYPHLSPSARTTIWKSQITRASASAWLNAGFMDRLTAYDINGRQIKNTVRMACSLAANEKREVCEVDILRGLKAWTEFEVDFGIERRTRIKRLGSALSRMRRGMRSYMWAKVMLVCKFPTHLPNRFFRGRSRRSPGRSRPG
jgi:SpoVK/Ycf46/Vps4 family AAA+-type ATPase